MNKVALNETPSLAFAKMLSDKMTSKSYFAIIDIGSNSVRLVTYSGIKRVPEVVFNEKVLAGLGSEVGRTGKLSDEAMALTLSTLKRFVDLCKHARIDDIYPLATAAIRDAENGQEFVDQVRAATGLDIQVIGGDEEARLAAQGVISAEGKAYGLMGDLGGGSLELAILDGRDIGQRVSLPIGPLRLIAEFGDDLKAMKHHIRPLLRQLPIAKNLAHKNFYMVGGAWRNIMKMMILERSIPLPILQGFRTNAKNMDSYCKRIQTSNPDYLPFKDVVSGRRLRVLPVAALILREVLKAFKIEDCKASTFGLREGFVYDILPDAVKSKDPFMSVCKELARERSRFAEHSRLLYDWTSNLFIGGSYTRSKNEARLHRAICYLSDIAWRGHADYRAEKAVDEILHGNFVGLSHAERTYVAAALNEAYGAPINVSPIREVLHLLRMKDVLKARILGAGLRLANRLSGGTAPLLLESSVRVSKGHLELVISEKHKDCASHIVSKRLSALGQLMAKNTSITFE